MATVKEVGDDGSAAGRPGVGTVDLDEGGGHHVVGLQPAKDLLTGLDIVVGHVEHVAWGWDKGGSMNNPARHDEKGPPQLLSGETET